jgi:hypothetical protein
MVLLKLVKAGNKFLAILDFASLQLASISLYWLETANFLALLSSQISALEYTARPAKLVTLEGLFSLAILVYGYSKYIKIFWFKVKDLQ